MATYDVPDAIESDAVGFQPTVVHFRYGKTDRSTALKTGRPSHESLVGFR